jgi:hypothetical protein
VVKFPGNRPRHSALVTGGATLIEGLLRRIQSGPAGSRALEICCLVLETLHTWAGRALTFGGRLCAGVLRHVAWPGRLALLAAVMAAATCVLAGYGRAWMQEQAEITPEQMRILAESGTLATVKGVLGAAPFAGIVLLLAAGVAFVRRRQTLWCLWFAAAVYAFFWLGVLYVIICVPSELYIADGKVFSKFHRNSLWVSGFWLWVGVAAVGALDMLCLSLSGVRVYYGSQAVVQPSGGDRIAEQLTTKGRDPRYTTSVYWAVFVHVFFLFLLPILLRGCSPEMDPYGVPKGQGLQIIQVVQVKKEKKKPKKRYFFNPNSPISFYQPEIDDSRIRDQVEQNTQDTYVATAMKQTGLGKGGPGKGGWPHGMENARVRFLRLKYDGGDWDQDMGIGADYNLLVMFKKLAGFKIADNTEAIPISALRRFPKNRAPPFAFITGSGGINVSQEDVKALRWYCTQEAGMLFADNGGGNFNSSFRGLMKRVFPELDWVDIANDDILFQQPFLFPNGAPPLWHHSGMRAVGMKHNGRWVVFYHQGDLNDAWKTGHSGVSEAQALQAYKLGINIINYAFNQYMSAHFGD